MSDVNIMCFMKRDHVKGLLIFLMIFELAFRETGFMAMIQLEADQDGGHGDLGNEPGSGRGDGCRNWCFIRICMESLEYNA